MSGRLVRLFPWILVGLVCVTLGIRLFGALFVLDLAERDPAGLLRSDPGLIYYITRRIVENRGWPPDDFRADPHIESPETTDIPAMFTVGQEFLVGWGYLLLGEKLPLHVTAVVLMNILASLTVIGIAGLARELTGSKAWACLAGLFYVSVAGSYRTIGSILVREDLSLPLFTLHLYLAARALRLKSAGAIVLAALTAVAALATWHAMSFVFTIEIFCVFAWFLRTGENPMDAKQSWIFPAVLVAGSLSIPVLFSKLFLLSMPMQMLGVLLAMPYLRRVSGRGDLGRVVTGLLALALVGLACEGLKRWIAPGSGDYAHVLEMMIAKLRYLGDRPADPQEISFGARLLWEGVFQTSSPVFLMKYLGALAFLTPVAALAYLDSWWRGRGDGREASLVAFGAISLILALLVQRLIALASILSPLLAVVLLRSSLNDRVRTHWIAGLVLAQCLLTGSVLTSSPLSNWYTPSLVQQLASTIRYVRDQLPAEGTIAADFVTSTAILAQTSHPVVLQPKYETARSRERIERFTLALYQKTPEEFQEILRREFGARYLLVDRPFLWGNRYEAGLRFSAKAPPRESAAFRLLNKREGVYGGIPGYRLLFRSRGLDESQEPVTRYVLYELVNGGETPRAAGTNRPGRRASDRP